jgi:PEP-CTERM motif
MRHLVAILAGLLLPVTAFAVPVLEITDGTMNVGAMRVGTGIYIGGGRFDFGGEGFRLDSASSYRRVVLGGAEFHFSPVPEPATLLLVGSGAAAGGLLLRRRRR